MSLWDRLHIPAHTVLRTTFGATVTYRRTGEEDRQVTAIFTDAYKLVEMGAEVGMCSTVPMFEIRTADLAILPSQGDLIIRATGDRYEVTRYEPDRSSDSVKLFCVEA